MTHTTQSNLASKVITDEVLMLASNHGLTVQVTQDTDQAENPREFYTSTWVGIDCQDIEQVMQEDRLQQLNSVISAKDLKCRIDEIKRLNTPVGRFYDSINFALVHKYLNDKGEVNYSLSDKKQDTYGDIIIDDIGVILDVIKPCKDEISLTSIHEDFEHQVAQYSDYINNRSYTIDLIDANGSVVGGDEGIYNTGGFEVNTCASDAIHFYIDGDK